MIKIVGIGIIAAVCSLLLSELGYRGKKPLAVIGFILILAVGVEGCARLFGAAFDFCQGAGVSAGAKAALKIIGASYLFGIASDIISELGEPLIAKGVSVVGRVEILLIVLPYFVDIMKLGAELLE